MITPVIMYGYETWFAVENDKVILNTWGRKVFRKVYGAVTKQEIWKIETNPELIWLTDINRRRREWLGM
jgi:hypothetical protein